MIGLERRARAPRSPCVLLMRVHARIQGHDSWPTSINTYPSYLWKCYASSATEKMCLCQLTVSHIFGLTFTAAVIHICLQRAVITRMTRSPPPPSHSFRQCPTFWLVLQDMHFSKVWLLPFVYEVKAFFIIVRRMSSGIMPYSKGKITSHQKVTCFAEGVSTPICIL